MKFIEFKPHKQLAPFIDAYWNITCTEGVSSTIKVLPDGCVDIMINLGNDLINECDKVVLKSEKAYLGGAITQFKEGKTVRETNLVGVRFKPSAFSYFYKFSSLYEVTNTVVELSNDLIPTISSFAHSIPQAFDLFYYKKLIQPKCTLLPVVETINQRHGGISVDHLADVHCTTVRQLERNFKYHIGLSPKEFINIIRYKFAQQLILTKGSKRTLADVAFHCGYYDQAHLTNEIKKYTGVTPSNL